MDITDVLPSPPSFSEEDWQYCQGTNDYKPMLFEWYKFVGMLANVLIHIQPTSPGFRPLEPQRYYILVGLLTRCTRLMLSNIALCHEGTFGETTAIIDRCIFESAVKIMWLCHRDSQEEFERYLTDGLKTELEFKDHLHATIASNGGDALPIETRMLRSIDRHIDAAGVTEAEIRASKRQRDVASMIEGLGMSRVLYVIGQRIGSHHVHGTWSSLYMHYLQEEHDQGPYRFGPRGHECDIHANQFFYIMKFMLRTMEHYAYYVLQETYTDAFKHLFRSIEAELAKLLLESEPTA